MPSRAHRLDVARFGRACVNRVRHGARLLLGLLRELGDENAYARYLAAHGHAHSAEAWRRFSDERLRAKYVRPKCC